MKKLTSMAAFILVAAATTTSSAKSLNSHDFEADNKKLSECVPFAVNETRAASMDMRVRTDKSHIEAEATEVFQDRSGSRMMAIENGSFNEHTQPLGRVFVSNFSTSAPINGGARIDFTVYKGKVISSGKEVSRNSDDNGAAEYQAQKMFSVLKSCFETPKP